MRKHVLPALTVAGLLAISPATAFAGGSDSPTPYEVTEAGVTLPDGEVFPAHGHINIKVDGVGYGIHFDPNNGHPGGAWIGQSFIPWTAFGVDTGCAEWVQIHGFNEHFGEGGQEPICFGDEAPEPEPDPGESIPLIPLEPATPIEPEPTPEPEPEPEPEAPGEEIPLTPLEPATPVIPATPLEPATPVVPVTPLEPVVPDAPETPEDPEVGTPEVPEAPTSVPVVTTETTTSGDHVDAATPVKATPRTVG